MTTITTNSTATVAGPILAIDLGKYKSVACVYRSADDLRFLFGGSVNHGHLVALDHEI